MRILVSNDDGIDAPGLQALVEHLEPLGDVWVVAPRFEQSASSHALTMRSPLRVHAGGGRRWSVEGTPADCIYVALHHLLEQPPDLVVSGINNGSNLGTDVHYSGTVAAAREASLHGVAGIAVSLHRDDSDHRPQWTTAGQVAARVVRRCAGPSMPHGLLLNVNVPNRSPDQLLGLRATRLGARVYANAVDARVDPRGNDYLWIGGQHLNFGDGDDRTDGPCVEAGFASVTPLSAHITDLDSLERLREWTDE